MPTTPPVRLPLASHHRTLTAPSHNGTLTPSPSASSIQQLLQHHEQTGNNGAPALTNIFILLHCLYHAPTADALNGFIARLYHCPDRDVDFVLPQLCQLHLDFADNAAKRLAEFLTVKCAHSIHICLRTMFIVSAQEHYAHSAEEKQRMRDLIQACEMALMNSSIFGDEDDITSQPNDSRRLSLRTRHQRHAMARRHFAHCVDQQNTNNNAHTQPAQSTKPAAAVHEPLTRAFDLPPIRSRSPRLPSNTRSTPPSSSLSQPHAISSLQHAIASISPGQSPRDSISILNSDSAHHARQYSSSALTANSDATHHDHSNTSRPSSSLSHHDTLILPLPADMTDSHSAPNHLQNQHSTPFNTSPQYSPAPSPLLAAQQQQQQPDDPTQSFHLTLTQPPASTSSILSSSIFTAVMSSPQLSSQLEEIFFALSKKVKCEYYNLELSMIHLLTHISTILVKYPPDKRKKRLRRQLEEIDNHSYNNKNINNNINNNNNKLLSSSSPIQNLYFPSSSLNAVHYGIKRLVIEQCTSLNSRDKAPFLLVFEVEYSYKSVYDYDIYTSYRTHQDIMSDAMQIYYESIQINKNQNNSNQNKTIDASNVVDPPTVIHTDTDTELHVSGVVANGGIASASAPHPASSLGTAAQEMSSDSRPWSTSAMAPLSPLSPNTTDSLHSHLPTTVGTHTLVSAPASPLTPSPDTLTVGHALTHAQSVPEISALTGNAASTRLAVNGSPNSPRKQHQRAMADSTHTDFTLNASSQSARTAPHNLPLLDDAIFAVMPKLPLPLSLSTPIAVPPSLTESDPPCKDNVIWQRLDSAFGESWRKRKENLRLSATTTANGETHYESYRMKAEWDLMSVIFKEGDDCRQEVLAMQLITLCNVIWSAAKIPLYLRPYSVMVTGAQSGLIETITDATSIDSLKKSVVGFTTLASFFHTYFMLQGAERHEMAINNYVQSMAGYSVVCYLLQIKDRHNGNIMMDRDGHIIHIDFGFMLSNSPGGNINFEASPFKLTAEYVEVMGGYDIGDETTSNTNTTTTVSGSGSSGSSNTNTNSKATKSHHRFSKFKTFNYLVMRGFLECRKHADTICLFIEMMGKASGLPCFAGRPASLSVTAIRKRLKLDMSDTECMNYCNEMVEESVDNWTNKQYDDYQRITNNIQ